MPVAVMDSLQTQHLVERPGDVKSTLLGIFLHDISQQILAVSPTHEVILAVLQCQLAGNANGEAVDVDDGNLVAVLRHLLIKHVAEIQVVVYETLLVEVGNEACETLSQWAVEVDIQFRPHRRSLR